MNIPAATDLRRERATLVGFCALLLVAGVGLLGVAGPPYLPGDLPRADDVVAILQGSSLPVGPVTAVLLDLAWLMWTWIVASLLLELALAAIELVAQGASWLRSVRSVVNRLSLPLARRAVAAAFAIQVVSRGVPIVAAQTIDTADSALVVQVDSPPTAVEAAGSSTPTYLVRHGDTLWSIAARAYGAGTEYPRVVEANLGRSMSDGHVFDARGVIRPGWQLAVPGARADVDVEEVDGQPWYVVRAGDTLSAIAESQLGDMSRWDELFDLNRGALTMDGQHALTDANVIWPGLRLRLPASATQSDTVESPEPDSVDLVVASAPLAPPELGSAPPIADPSIEALPAIDAEPPSPPPLLRTQHAFDPVVLEPANTSAEPQAAAAPQVNPAADVDVSLPNTPWHADLPTLPLAAGGIGLAAAAGLVFGARRIRRLRPLPQKPETEVQVEGGFAEAQLAHDLTRGLHGIGFDPLATLVARTERFLDEYNLTDVALVAVRHGHSSTTITLCCALSEQALLLDLAPVFAERLDAEVEASVSNDQDVLLRLTRLRRTRLLPPADATPSTTCLVPLGVLFDRQLFSASWDSLGHVLVVSLRGHGAETILTSLVATLTARRSPDQLRVWLLASARALPAPLFELPHLGHVVDPQDDVALAQATQELRAELDRRTPESGESDLVVVVPELASLGEHAADFALLASRAAELGVRFVMASTSPDDALASPLATHFTTRMVLSMQTEETSVALLGVADAAFLGGGGRLLLRVDGREPVELYGYQVPAEHLERLVKVMRSGYITPPPPEPAEVPTEPPADGPPPPEAIPPLAEPSSAHQHPGEHAPLPDHAAGSAQPAKLTPPAKTRASKPPRLTRVSDPPPTAAAPIQVVCFGSARVLCADQQVWPLLAGGDAKPWELLLYLACQPAEGIARDDAAEALWPDHEDLEDAPHRFRQLRYRLRQLLIEVPGAPRSDGIFLERNRLRLDPGVVHSDAQEFLNLVRGARVTLGAEAIQRLEQARLLYAGDLLDGPDARRYAWVTERDASGVTLREHFRRTFQSASLRLAELYTDNSAPDTAVELYRELSEIDPVDEKLWLALFHLHAERGDRPALRREERRMRELLRALADDEDAFGSQGALEPSRELTDEFQRLLASLRDREREPAAV